MVEKTKKQKRGSISEVDISTILKRYPATTVLALLQEVAQVADVKIDWNELVKKTKTGISSAREYQMLWRHLAYRDALLERLDDGDQPLDDDSDLEHELEAFPTVSSEASTEAAAFVKVLITSGLLRDSSLPNGSAIEAPLTINIPNRQLTEYPSENSQLTNFMQGTNITIPVTVKKQPQNSGTSGEGLDANGSASGHVPARRKRKTWSREEDDKLKAAVEKCGEGNWANILKGYFKDERKASQLSQRWAIIRKRAGNTNVASGSQPSDGQLAAAHRAVSLALDNPRSGSSVGPQSHHLSQQDSGATVAQRPQIPGSSPQSRVTIVRPSAKSALSPVKLVKATAVAAGARIATALDAASLLKAAQAKNAVHIIPVGGGSLMKSSVAGNSNPLPSLHPNMHYIRTGMAVTPPPPRSTRPGVSQQAQGHIQSNISSTAPESNASEAIHSATPTPIPQNELDVTTVADNVICSSGNAPRDQVQENRASSSGQREEVQDGFSGEDAPKEQVKEGQASVLGNKLEELLEKDQVTSGLGDALDKQVPKDQNGLPG